MTSAAMRIASILLTGAMLVKTGFAAAAGQAQQLGNWFEDPFVQVRNLVADCPEPLGPRLTRQQATEQEHARAERGTSCYLAGECTKPNAYAYDAQIVAEVIKLFDSDPALAADSSLWITVTRRFVYIEGCSGKMADIDKTEALIRTIPQVQQVVVNVTADPRGHLPYRRFDQTAQ
jgi:hypothetical protein